MEISVIASGSNGNCCLVEDKNSSILIDAGKSGREIESRMNSLGKSVENVDAIILTHAHHDHVAGAGVLSRRYNLPVYISKPAYSEVNGKLGAAQIRHFTHNKQFSINDLSIQPISTSHNTPSTGFVIGDFGIFTDTGKVTKEMETAMPKLRGVLLESNHDIDMVVHGPYPYFLKQWILSDQGHLNNIDASNLLNEKGKNLDFALLGHLSGNNNTVDLVKKTVETLVKKKIDYSICSRDKASGVWEL